MAQEFTGDSLRQAFSFPFREPNWRNKMITGSAIYLAGMIVPVLPWLVIRGYTARMARSVINDGREPYLPEWDDLGGLLTTGLRLIAVDVIYWLPVVLPLMVGYALLFIPLYTGILQATEPAEAALPWLAPMGGFMILMGVTMLASLVVGLVEPAVIAHVVATGEFRAAFRIRAWWRILRANLGGFILTYLIVLGAGMVVSLALEFVYLTIVLCCLLPIISAPLMFYLSLFRSALYAQAYRASVESLRLPV